MKTRRQKSPRCRFKRYGLFQSVSDMWSRQTIVVCFHGVGFNASYSQVQRTCVQRLSLTYVDSGLWTLSLCLSQVSTQQAEMDSKFMAMKRTINLLEKYGQKLPDMTQKFYTAAPQRYWTGCSARLQQSEWANPALMSRLLGPANYMKSKEKPSTLSLQSLKSTFSQPFKEKCFKVMGSLYWWYNHLSS